MVAPGFCLEYIMGKMKDFQLWATAHMWLKVKCHDSWSSILIPAIQNRWASEKCSFWIKLTAIHGECCVLNPFCPTLAKGSKWQKGKFLAKEQNVSVISTDINGISWCLTYFLEEDECLCIKFGLRAHKVKYKKTSITQIYIVCHLLPFTKVGQAFSDGTKTSSLKGTG